MNLYNRAYMISLSKEKAKNRTLDDFQLREILNSTKAKDGRPLQIRYNVTLDLNGQPSTCELVLYNLNESSKQDIIDAHGHQIRLHCGYLGDVTNTGYVQSEQPIPSIFIGDIINATSNSDGKDEMTTIYARSNYYSYKNKDLSKTWGKNTTVKQILQETAAELNAQPVFYGDFDSLPPYAKGFTFTGDAKSCMNDLAETFDFKWLIHNGQLLAVMNNENGERPVGDRKTIKLNPNDLLMGETEVVSIGEQYSEANVGMRLQPSLRVWDTLKFQSNNVTISLSSAYYLKGISQIKQGRYTVVGLIHKGDFYGDQWNTTAVCRLY